MRVVSYEPLCRKITMTKDKNQQDHDNLIALLPWFVNQTLDEHQMDIVSAHLEYCDECQSEVQFLSAMSETVKTDAQTSYRENASVEKNLRDVMARIDSDDLHPKPTTNGISIFQQVLKRITAFIPAGPTSFQGATAIAGVLVAVLGFQLYYGQTNDDYSVLSSSEVNNSAIRLSIELEPSMGRNEAHTKMRALFDRHGQEIGIEDGANGAYIIEIKDAMQIEALNELVLDLNYQTSVTRVEILP